MPKELLIDVSEYEAPQPFEEVIQLLSQMKAGEYIRMLHRKKPLPLLQFLNENGYDYKAGTVQNKIDISEESSIDSVSWEIMIWSKKDSSVNEYCLNAFK